MLTLCCSKLHPSSTTNCWVLSELDARAVDSAQLDDVVDDRLAALWSNVTALFGGCDDVVLLTRVIAAVNFTSPSRDNLTVARPSYCVDVFCSELSSRYRRISDHR